jgi:hypothetical protein
MILWAIQNHVGVLGIGVLKEATSTKTVVLVLLVVVILATLRIVVILHLAFAVVPLAFCLKCILTVWIKIVLLGTIVSFLISSTMPLVGYSSGLPLDRTCETCMVLVIQVVQLAIALSCVVGAQGRALFVKCFVQSQKKDGIGHMEQSIFVWSQFFSFGLSVQRNGTERKNGTEKKMKERNGT